VVVVNGLNAGDCKPLLTYLGRGQTAALMGSSGAGKSTLTNTLLGHAAQDTGQVHASGHLGHGMQGKHTTTSRSLFMLPRGGCIIDTPGLRTLRVDADANTVQSGYADIAQLAQQCRFGNCQHSSEPGCAVRPVLDPARLHNYNKLKRDAQRDQLSALQRQAQLSSFKQRSKAARLDQAVRGKLR
jgi:ribosome biogenesis GTPase / thiamine phosphate phosphatase